MAASDHTSKVQFHGSRLPPEEFMSAPLLHVGTKQAAEEVNGEVRVPLHKLHFSDHAVFHDTVLSDEDANEVHARFLESKGDDYPISASVHATRSGRSSWDVDDALEALAQNKIVRYENQWEDVGQISHLVPSPHMNLRFPGRRDPQKQAVLPMDYSNTTVSATTHEHRLRREALRRDMSASEHTSNVV